MSQMEKARVFIHTFGCQMNDLDSDKMVALLLRGGFRQASSAEEADVVLLNTCSVREKAVHKLYSMLGRLKRPGLVLGVTGCVARQEGQALVHMFPYVKLVMGPDSIPRVASLLDRVLAGEGPLVDVREHEGLEYPFVSELPPDVEERICAFVTIQKGCDNHCTYCIVPTTRGEERSRPSQEILEEVRALAAAGIKEVTLLGQNVNSYGLKTPGELSFPQLLRLLHDEVPAIRRLRFTTSHPKDLSPALIEAYASLPRLCPHIHLPVQSGSSRVLAAMNRSYTREQYLALVGAVKAAVPDMTITTDLIVGFPTETEAEFEETLTLMEEVRFDAAFSFMYSPRPGTPAAALPDDVPLEVKRDRLIRLQRLQKQLTTERNKAMVGSLQTVLVEGNSRQSEQELTGRTPGNKTVNFPGERHLLGEEIGVRITFGSVNSLRGEISSAKVTGEGDTPPAGE